MRADVTELETISRTERRVDVRVDGVGRDKDDGEGGVGEGGSRGRRSRKKKTCRLLKTARSVGGIFLSYPRRVGGRLLKYYSLFDTRL